MVGPPAARVRQTLRRRHGLPRAAQALHREAHVWWLGRCRLAKDFENLARSHLAFVQPAMIRLMMRRIARLRAASQSHRTGSKTSPAVFSSSFWLAELRSKRAPCINNVPPKDLVRA